MCEFAPGTSSASLEAMTKPMWPLGKTEWLLATLTSMEECGQTKVTKTKGTKEVSQPWNKVYQKSIQSRKDYLTSGLGLSGLLKVFESYRNASSNQPGAVITQDNCQTRLLRPLIWNSLLCTPVQCYITISTGAAHRKGQSISWQIQANCIT
jgi:hypothetical protein